jgi:hypothetical protein
MSKSSFRFEHLFLFVVAFTHFCVSPLAFSSDPDQTQWKTIHSKRHHIMMSYPRSYRSVRETATVDPLEQQAHFQVVFFLQSGHDASISVAFRKDAFDPKGLVNLAPTGVVTPPALIKVKDREFYYYGAGGGGVHYPDRYYWGDQYGTFVITFDGPYPETSKQPGPRMKEMEMQILRSISTYG